MLDANPEEMTVDDVMDMKISNYFLKVSNDGHSKRAHADTMIGRSTCDETVCQYRAPYHTIRILDEPLREIPILPLNVE